MNAFLTALVARAGSLKTRTDEWPDRAVLVAPLTPDQLQRSEDRLGFALPSLLVDIYRTVGNGGFGPGYGLIGVEGGITNEDNFTAVDLYGYLRAPDPSDPVRNWPKGLLPICSWGCAMYTCVDCTSTDARVSHWEPNLMEQGMNVSRAIFPHQMSLQDWFTKWTEGHSMWTEVERAMGATSDEGRG